MQNWDWFWVFLAYLLITWRIENSRDRILKRLGNLEAKLDKIDPNRLDDLEAKLDEIESKQDGF
jgi:hypothetical protein